MKLNKLILVVILALAIISCGAVCAESNQTSDLNCIQLGVSVYDIETTTNHDAELFTAEESIIDSEIEEYYMGGIIPSELEMTPYKLDNNSIDATNVIKCEKDSVKEKMHDTIGTVNIVIDKNCSSRLENCTSASPVEYGELLKQNFDEFDGVVTNKNFDDYFEVVNNYYQLRSFIPDGATLDLRGYISGEYGDVLGISITRPCHLTSTTGDAYLRKDVYIQNDADGTTISNIKVNLMIYASNCNVINSTMQYISSLGTNIRLENSTVGNLNNINSDSNIINCTFNMSEGVFFSEGVNNLTIVDSTFNNGFYIHARYMWKPIMNLTFRNCAVNGKTQLLYVKNSLIENCTFDDGFMDLMMIENVTLKNNFINASSSTYAVSISGTKNCRFSDNIIYSKYYCGNNAIVYQYKFDINTYPNNMNVFESNSPENQMEVKVDVNRSVSYGDDVILKISVPANGNVMIDVNGKKSMVGLIDGCATYVMDKYELGLNNITVLYENDLNDAWGVAYATFNVHKANVCPIELVYGDVNEGMFFTANVVLPEDAEGIIIFTLSNDTHCITVKQDANGTNNLINLLALSPGNYTMNATFKSTKYVDNSTIANINVVHVPVYRLTAADVVMDYGDGSKYKVLVTVDGEVVGDGEIVKLTFNGKTYNVKTDTGYATLTLNSAPNTYLIQSEYNGITISSKVIIKNILKASNISKKKAKNIKFSATLKRSNGKVIVGKKITFKFKGKTYSAKTNKKGVATITLKNLKIGKYTITSKYGACTVKNTIKIKK